jgi:nucleotide-binding universal stress UspA family protein
MISQPKEGAMAYRTLMVYLQAGEDNAGVLGIAAGLADQFDANVIGVAACQPCNPMYEEGFAAGDIVAEDRAEIDKELQAAAGQFRAALDRGGRRTQWRATITYGPLADYIAEQARAADLVIIGKPIGGTVFDQTRCVDVGGLVMQAGRPVLLVPQGITSLSLRHVLVGWNDTRESRRAVSDALPLLRAAGHVTLLELCKTGQRSIAQMQVRDVAAWLKQQDVDAAPLLVETDAAEPVALRLELRKHGCDLFVAGAYGHNRLNEWVFGGMTRDVLLDPESCVLLSH